MTKWLHHPLVSVFLLAVGLFGCGGETEEPAGSSAGAGGSAAGTGGSAGSAGSAGAAAGSGASGQAGGSGGAGGASAGAGGGGGVTVKITVTDPNGLNEYGQWAEYNVFAGGCPSEEDLANGTYPPPLSSQIVEPGAPFDAGALAPETFGFAVLLRAQDCAIVGYGCTKANLATVEEIKLKVNPTYVDDDGNLQPVGACEAGFFCQDAKCVSGTGGAGGRGVKRRALAL